MWTELKLVDFVLFGALQTLQSCCWRSQRTKWFPSLQASSLWRAGKPLQPPTVASFVPTVNILLFVSSPVFFSCPSWMFLDTCFSLVALCFFLSSHVFLPPATFFYPLPHPSLIVAFLPLPFCPVLFLISSPSPSPALVVTGEQLALLQYRLSMSSMPCQPHAPPGSGTLHTYQVLLPFHTPPPLWGLLEVNLQSAQITVKGTSLSSPVWSLHLHGSLCFCMRRL